MEYKDLIQAMQQKLKKLDTDQLKDMVSMLVNDDREEASDVLTAVLNDLEKRLPAQQFVIFCNSIN